MKPINKKFHPDFYSKQKKRSVNYFNKSPGELDILRMVSGHPCWERSTFVESLTKKSIILADWKLPYWTEFKDSSIHDALHLFLDNNFQIYFWHQDQLASLYDPKNLDNMAKEITPVSDQILLDAAREQYQLLPQQIIIINYHAMPLLFGETRLEKHQMISTHLFSMKMSAEKIKHIYPDFSEIIIYDDREKHRCAACFPDISLTYRSKPERINYNPIEHNYNKIKAIALKLQNDTTMLTKLDERIQIDNSSVDKHHDFTACFQDINWIGLNDLTIEENIVFDPSALSTTTSLRYLYLGEIRCREEAPFINLDLPQIRRLGLTSLSSPVSSLILCEQLQSLRLDRVTLDQLEQLFSGQFTLNKLHTININILDLSEPLMPVLQAIKARTPYLKELVLSVTQDPENEPKELDVYPLFDDSVKINLCFFNDINNAHSLQVCQFFTKISSLDVELPDNESDDELMNESTFPSDLNIVKSLHLRESIIDSLKLNEILKHSNKLTELSLNCCSRLDNNLFEDVSLPHLEKLEIDSCEGIEEYSYVFKSLSHSSALKEIKIDGSLHKDDLDTEYCLHSLEHLELNCPSPALLFNLIKNSERLEVVQLANIDIEHISIIEEILKKNKFLNSLHLRMSESLQYLGLKEKLQNISPSVLIKIEYDQDEEDIITNYATVDINTEYYPTTYNIPQLFHSIRFAEAPQPDQYRLSVYNDIEFIEKSFCLKKTGSLQLIPIEWVASTLFPEQETNCYMLYPAYKGKQIIKNLGRTWTPIASLCSGEFLSAWEVQYNQPIEMQYSLRDNLYYIRNTAEDKNITIILTFEISHLVYLSQPKLSSNIVALVDYFKTFQAGPLDTSKINSLNEAAKAIITNKVGACRHRAVAFFVYMKANMPAVPVRIIENDCHMFVEVYQANQWIALNLGGYPGTVKTYEFDSYITQSESDNFTDVFFEDTDVTYEFDSYITQPESYNFTDDFFENADVTYEFDSYITPSESYNITDDFFEDTDVRTDVLIDKTLKLKITEFFPTNKTLQSEISAKFDKQQSNHVSSAHYGSTNEYLETLLSGNHHTLRIDIPKTATLQFQRSLQTYANEHDHPLFFVHNPDDLVCSNAYIALCDEYGSGKLHSGPGGALHNFLTQCTIKRASAPPVLVINYNTFSSEELDTWSSVLNARRTDATELPSHLIILGLFDPMIARDHEPDEFDAQFERIYPAPLDCLPQAMYTLPVLPTDSIPFKRTIIDLGHSSRWRMQLLDHWILRRSQFILEQGELTAALKIGDPIEILNPPDDEEFVRYWALQYHDTSSVPPLFFGNKYTWMWDKSRVERTTAPHPEAHVLNPKQLPSFIRQYKIDAQQLSQISGYLSEYQDKTLYLYITRDLSQDEWVSFYREYLKYPTIKLSFATATSVTPPPGLEDIRLHSKFAVTSKIRYQAGAENRSVHKVHEDSSTDLMPDFNDTEAFRKKSIEPKDRFSNICHQTHTQLILTNDMDLALESVVDDKNAWDILDISECSGADLLMRLSCIDLKSNLFVEEKQVLLQAMDLNKKIILIGDFSESLIDDLAPFLLERLRSTEVSGEILLISDVPFPYLTANHALTYTWEDRKTLLSELFSPEKMESKSKSFQCLPYIKQYTTLKNETAYRPSEHISAWDGLLSLSSSIYLHPFDYTNSEEQAEQFLVERESKFTHALKKWPYVILSGLTGVGKTTFIEHYFKRNLYQGSNIQTLVEWATHPHSEEPIVLFIDESNLLTRDWSEFEGLLYSKRRVFIDGQVYSLSSQHKVIFAGNPVNYSADRKIARLFDRHGCSLVFEPLSTAFIYEKIVKPIFENTALTLEAQRTIGEELLKVYKYIIECSNYHTLISPREVQMMTLLVVQEIIRYPSRYDSLESTQKIANHYAYEIGKNLVLTHQKMMFDELFRPEESDSNEKFKQVSDFIYTESRLKLKHVVLSYLNLRLYRQKSIEEGLSINNAQLYGGLGGFIIEGEPCCGKSSLVHDILQSSRLRNHKDYCIILPSLPYNEKKRLLLDAFEEGKIVVMKNFNSSSMMEQLLNHLLMGRTPEGKRPKKPGFLLIGIQLAGRALPSNALARRIQTCVLPAYDNNELNFILEQKGLKNAQTREALISAYSQKRVQSKSDPLLTKLNFCHLMEVAEPYFSRKRSMADAAPRFFTSKTTMDDAENYSISDSPHKKAKTCL